MTNWNPTVLLETAEDVARHAGGLLLEKSQEPRKLTNKGFRDWVTDADVAAQDLIAKHIRSRFPDHGFLTEEAAPDLPGEGDVIWIVDPLDGTSNYSRGQSNFCVSIAAAAGQDVQVGVIYDPVRDELFSAAINQVGTLNGEPIAVSEIEDPSRSIVGLDWGHSHTRRRKTLELLEAVAHDVHSVRAIGSAALALAWVAAGRLDAYFNVNLKRWDYAAGALLVTLAGGRFSTVSDGPVNLAHPTESCLASNGLLHQKYVDLLVRRQ
jgi:myo-inositol-1(or 4)-monophosphatase